jgi:hypothetical protein
MQIIFAEISVSLILPAICLLISSERVPAWENPVKTNRMIPAVAMAIEMILRIII